MLRFWPARRQARLWETQNRSCRTITALRGRSGLRSFPLQAPTASPGLRLEHRLVELGVSEQALEAVVLLLQLLEAFGLCGFHAAVELLPAVIGGSRYLQGSAHIGDALALVEELLSGPQLADDLLGSVTIAVQRASPSQVWRAPKY